VDVLDAAFDEIDAMIAADTARTDKLEDIRDKLEKAVTELRKTPPALQAALGAIEGAVGEIEAAASSGDLTPSLAARLRLWITLNLLTRDRRRGTLAGRPAAVSRRGASLRPGGSCSADS
jgi:hypothetical protein